MVDKSIRPIASAELKDAGSASFQTTEELVAWVTLERAFWSWLSELQSRNIGLEDNRLPRFRNTVEQLMSGAVNLSTDTTSNSIQELRNHLAEYANTGLSSATARSQHVRHLLERNGKIVALAAVCEFLGCTWNNLSSVPTEIRYEVRHGRMAAHLFDFGIGEGASVALSASINEMSAAYSAKLSQHSSRFEEVLGALKFDHSASTTTNKADRDERNAEWDRFKESANANVIEAIARINSTDTAFKEQMKLRSSVRYWADKAKEHSKAAKAQIGVLVVYFLLATGGLFWVISGIFATSVDLATKLDQKSATPLLLLAGTSILIASAVVWVARLLVRVYFDERQRAQDARERAVMAETYSALTQEGLVSEAERVLALRSLFRPTSENVGGDDGAPEIIAQAILAKTFDPKSQKP